MAKAAFVVKESVSELLSLENVQRNEGAALRLTMLRLLKEEPDLTFTVVSERLNVSERSVQRWCSEYRKSGLDGLMRAGVGKPQKASRIADYVLEELKVKLDRGELTTLKEMQHWLKRSHNIRYSIGGIWNLVNIRLKSGKFADQELPDTSGGEIGMQGQGGGDPFEPLLNFLNGLPVEAGILEMVEAFRDKLQALLGDVDRVSVNVRVSSRLTEASAGPLEGLNVTHYSAAGEQGSNLVVTSTDDERPSDRLLKVLQDRYAPVDHFYPPHVFDYHAGTHDYVGTIVLWRQLSNPPVSTHTLGLMVRLQPFLTFLFSDMIVRYQHSRPVHNVFQTALVSIGEQCGLTPQERKVLVLQLLGEPYKQIAHTLKISVDTVKHYIKSIHNKTNTRSQGELFARYFSIRPELKGIDPE